MNRDDAVLICRLIAGLVVSDDDLDPKEDAFIERLLARFGIPSSDRDLIFPILDATEAATALGGLAADLREQAMSLLIEAAAVDGRIADEERTHLQAVADAIGMAHADLEARLARELSAKTGKT
jgi:uncharacterized tellurite resistance protein B-like protein